MDFINHWSGFFNSTARTAYVVFIIVFLRFKLCAMSFRCGLAVFIYNFTSRIFTLFKFYYFGCFVFSKHLVIFFIKSGRVMNKMSFFNYLWLIIFYKLYFEFDKI